MFVYKVSTNTLDELNYQIDDLTFDRARSSNLIVSLADNQMLRSIRDIQKRDIDFKAVSDLYKERKIEKANLIATGSEECQRRIRAIQDKINKKLFVPEYLIIVVDDTKHYKRIQTGGVKINGRTYRRFSCSAGQARKSNVVLIDDEISDELRRRLDNGRDLGKPLAPSKYCSYFGLASSATHTVSTPRFIVVKDFSNETQFRANVVEEVHGNKDDKITIKDETRSMNRTDGMGLISPEQSKRWAQELGLDYTPSQWCVRQNFLKGMLCTFDFRQFCVEVNGGNFMVETIYRDSDGQPIMADLRDVDVIISESQFKLWDSFPDLDTYVHNGEANHLDWGITQPSPKEYPDILHLNYQFIQTLNLKEDDIERLSSQFVEWIKGVSGYDQPQMLLFLMGTNNSKQRIEDFIKSEDYYWIKSLIVNPSIRNDRHVRSCVRRFVKKRIEDACMGRIFVDGNFQVLVSDPYGYAQHVCGLPVTGLLRGNEFYSNYWNQRSVDRVDSMRSPLTYRSEHVILNLRNDEETRKWYRFCESGIIVNYHGHEVVNWGGADFDFDILATTSNKTIINGVYMDELPIIYKESKPDKILFSEDDLFEADMFSFGSEIGHITNTSTNGYALLPNLIKQYGIESPQVDLVMSRQKQCCKAQAMQIDKAKIGNKVKGIPKLWLKEQTIRPSDSQKERELKEFYNSIRQDKPPYFFRYRYKKVRSDYKNFVDQMNTTCKQKYGVTITDLIKSADKSGEQKQFVEDYHANMPVVDSDAPVNVLCKYIERIDSDLLRGIKMPSESFDYSLLRRKGARYTSDEYECMKTVIGKAKKEYGEFMVIIDENDDADDDELKSEKYGPYKLTVSESMQNIGGNRYSLVNAAVDYFYEERGENSDKSLMWEMFGPYLLNNVIANTRSEAMFPLPDSEGEIAYLGKRFHMTGVDAHEIL